MPHPHLAVGRRAQPLPRRLGHGRSPLFSSFLAGHPRPPARAHLFLAPTINSYKRFQPGSFAPTALVWAEDNRTCALRVVGHGNGMRVECRVAGGDANPYLAFSALIAAGLAGVDGDYELEPAWEGSGYDAADRPHVPATLRESIACMGILMFRSRHERLAPRCVPPTATEQRPPTLHSRPQSREALRHGLYPLDQPTAPCRL